MKKLLPFALSFLALSCKKSSVTDVKTSGPEFLRTVEIVGFCVHTKEDKAERCDVYYNQDEAEAKLAKELCSGESKEWSEDCGLEGLQYCDFKDAMPTDGYTIVYSTRTDNSLKSEIDSTKALCKANGLLWIVDQI